ncbi:trypsin-like peptidase domain-containing protein [Streptomyces mirabilis]|uniref:nSTAND1 domain-containing NTPase n=1 Tax=Streptomyces mirabilis TaxID=68239 RepID=UPI00367EE0CC
MTSTNAVASAPGSGPGLKIQAAVAQILSAEGGVAGAGFLIGEDVVVTCAHVVRAGGHGPGERVQLAFPRAEGSPQAEGQVLIGPWRASDADDVAIIRLSDVPATVEPLPVGSAAGCRGHRVRSFGFPAQAPPGGHFGYGTAGDLLPPTDVAGGGGLLQLTGANDLTQGFSGGPVVDEVTGLVIGMVTAITAPDGHLRGQGIAYATPAQVLREVWPALMEREVRPYRGLEPFTAEHTAFFHGRDTAVETVLSALAENRRVLLLLGPSGSGKSSLVQAGVLPALEDGRLPGSDRWLPVLVPRPGPDLAAELARHGLPGAADGGLAAAVRHRLEAEPGCERIVLVIDQFEEVFTPPAPSAAAARLEANDAPPGTSLDVLEQITAMIGSSVAVSVVLVMRDDFYPQLAARAPALLEVAAPGLVNVPATLSRQDLHAIVTRPAHQAGAAFEEGLTERIIADVLAADPHGATVRRAPVTMLAPLELALNRLWERRVDGRLTHTGYERIGQITGNLATWCNAAIDQLPESHHTTARRILTALVRPADEAHHIPATRQQVPLGVLRDLASDTSADDAPAQEMTDAVLATLTRHRIITTSARDPGPPPSDLVAELIHDTLTRDWAELRAWVDQDHRFHTWLSRAEDQQARWIEGHHPADLLHGTDLAEGLDWSQQRGLPSSTARFVTASHHNQQAALRRTRRVNAFLAGVLVLAVVAAGLAFWQRQTVVTAQQQALSRQLAAQSDALIDTDPDLASLLAIQAYRTSPTTEATTSLRAAADLPLQRRLTGHVGPVESVAFRDAHTLVTVGQDGTVRLWDTSTGRIRTTLTDHIEPESSMDLSPDGRTLVTVGQDGTVRLWDTSTGRTRTTLTGHTEPVSSEAFSQDGRTLAASSEDGTVRLWDTSTGRTRISLTGHTGVVASVGFSRDGRTLASSSEDGTVRLWDTSTGRTRTTLTGHDDLGSAVALSPDGRTLATDNLDRNEVRLWDTSTGRTRTTLTGNTGLVYGVVFSPDGRTLAASSEDGTVRLWDTSTGRTRTTLTGHTGVVTSVAFSRDGRTLATGSYDKTVRLWDISTGRSRTTLTGRDDSVHLGALSPDVRTLAIGSKDGRVQLWDTSTGRIRTTLTGLTGLGSSMAFSRDGRTLAIGNEDGRVRLWDTSTGRIRTTLTGLTGLGSSVALSPDGRTLATGSKDGTVRLWDTSTGRTRTTLTGHKGMVYYVVFSPDGRTLAASSEDGTVRLWDTSTGRTRTTLTESVSFVEFSPDGRTLATNSWTNTVRLWDTSTGRTRTTLTGHKDIATPAAFSPDGRTVAIGSEDGTVRLWDTSTGRTRTTLTGHDDPVSLVAFRDGRTLATVGEDATVRLWDVELPDQATAIKKICQAVGRDLTPEERGIYLAGQTPSPVCPT